MESIAIDVFKAAVGFLLNKAADKLEDGDATSQTFRGLIVSEIHDVKSKLDGLSRKDLKSSISSFEVGIELLYEVFDKADKADKARSRSENSAVTTEAASAEVVSLVKGMKNLKLTDLDESASRLLLDAKEQFKDARKDAKKAFNNDALETADRILAMQYRVMAKILEKVDNPEDAVTPCRVYIKQLNSLPAVQNSFQVQFKKGIQAVKALVGKDDRRKIIAEVCHVNRVVYDVTGKTGKVIWNWPMVDTGRDKVDPLRDERVAEVLRKQRMENCCVIWSFGEDGEEEHKLKWPWGIASNSSGQFIVGHNMDLSNVKVFDSTGKFLKLFSLPETELFVREVATDINDNIYVLVELKKPGAERDRRTVVYEFTNTAELQHTFPVRGAWGSGLTVTDSGKVLVLRCRDVNVVDVYKNDGQFVCSFGKGILREACDITAADDGRVMVVDSKDSCVHIFSERGDHLNNFELQVCYAWPGIAFHRASEHVVVASLDGEKYLLHVEIYTKGGEFVRSTQIHEDRINELHGLTVTAEGRIAVVFYHHSTCMPPKVLVL